jgi:hypothetical protein
LTIAVRDGLWVEIDVWKRFNNCGDYFKINGVKNNQDYAGPNSSQWEILQSEVDMRYDKTLAQQ